jgi:hypothetical protein
MSGLGGYQPISFSRDSCPTGVNFGGALGLSRGQRGRKSHASSANWHLAKLFTGRVACPNLPKTPCCSLGGKHLIHEREPREPLIKLTVLINTGFLYLLPPAVIALLTLCSIHQTLSSLSYFSPSLNLHIRSFPHLKLPSLPSSRFLRHALLCHSPTWTKSTAASTAAKSNPCPFSQYLCPLSRPPKLHDKPHHVGYRDNLNPNPSLTKRTVKRNEPTNSTTGRKGPKHFLLLRL